MPKRLLKPHLCPSLARTAIGSMLDAARGILDEGQFGAFETAASFKDIEALIDRGSR